MLSKAKFYSVVERIQHRHGNDDTTFLGYIFFLMVQHQRVTRWLCRDSCTPVLQELCAENLSGGGALIQFCQQKNSHSKAHDWLSDHHVSIWPAGSSQVKPSTSVPVLNRKSLLVTSMTTVILWHYKQHPRDTRMELQRNNMRLIFYSIKSGWSARIMDLLCFFSKLWHKLFFNATFLECQ